MSDIEERVKKIVVEHLGVEEAKIQSDSKFIDDLGADSLDTVELVMAFEEEFGCEIPDDAAEKIVTLKDAVTYLSANSKIGSTSSSATDNHSLFAFKKWVGRHSNFRPNSFTHLSISLRAWSIYNGWTTNPQVNFSE